MNNPPIYGKRTLKLAFEFGLLLSEVAKEKGVELTPEMSAKAEQILINELRVKGMRKTALNFLPLILAVFEI